MGVREAIRGKGRLLLASALLCAAPLAPAYAVVPGTGQRTIDVGDNFEDPNWTYTLQLPKSSSNIDGDQRLPAGEASNGRIYESTYRGTPDVVQRVLTPPGGLPGSKCSIVLRSLQTGIPGRPSYEQQQDDLIVNVSAKLGGFVPVQWTPSVVTRVYLPEWQYWEQRTGTSFAMRADCQGTKMRQQNFGWRRQMGPEMENYWPGIFIQYNRPATGQKPSAMLILRAGERGEDISGPVINEPGWWTLGMSFTADGRVHYYASAGVDDLKPEDHLGSYYPYGFRCDRLQAFFFNVVNWDDGRSWSTPWIIDDPSLYLIKR